MAVFRRTAPAQHPVPDGLPVLSRGKHRNARRGACFMELASYLAGERWSDHPSCTHPLLADLARQVNDWTPDEHRSALAPLIPSVIGTSTGDPRVGTRIALGCAQAALPVVAAERQNVMAVGLLTAERVLAMMDNRAPAVAPETRQVLAVAPVAARYAVDYTASAVVSPEGFRHHGAPHLVRLAVQGVAVACVPNAHELLRSMLVSGIAVCEEAVDRPAAARPALDSDAWAQACELTARS